MPPGPLLITCTGSSTLTHAAELATLHLTISSTGPDPRATAQNVTTSAAAIAAHLKTLTLEEDDHDDLDAANVGVPHPQPTAPVSKWTLSSLSTGSWQPEPRRQATDADPNEADVDVPKPTTTTTRSLPPRLYTASTTMTATFLDFSALGSFTSSHLLSTPYVSIERIEWDVLPATKMSLERRGRREAVKDAMIKAKDYADAVGKEDFGVLVISDVAAGGGGRLMAMGGAFGRGVGMAMGGEEEEEMMMRFRPEEVGVSCEVVVKFDAA